MIRAAELAAIKAATIDLAFRRWERPRVRVGTKLRTSVGLIEVTSLQQVTSRELTADDARRAGATTLASLREQLADRQGAIHRIGLIYAGADPRIALRQSAPTDDEVDELRSWLERLGSWSWDALKLIDCWPGRRAPELAAILGQETADFKRDVRKLKERGLTESLDIGYRLSVRGIAVLQSVGHQTHSRPPTGTPLPRVGAGASKALIAAGITTLEDLQRFSADQVSELSGVGPFAMSALRGALAEADLEFAD